MKKYSVIPANAVIHATPPMDSRIRGNDGFGVRALLLTIGMVCAISAAHAQTIVMASTTSTEQSGLFAHLLPAFKSASGIDIKVVALGTGQALDTGKRGDADVSAHVSVPTGSCVRVSRGPCAHTDVCFIGRPVHAHTCGIGFAAVC